LENPQFDPCIFEGDSELAAKPEVLDARKGTFHPFHLISTIASQIRRNSPEKVDGWRGTLFPLFSRPYLGS